MKRNNIIFIVVLIILGSFFIVTTCFRGEKKEKIKDLPPGTHAVTVTEIIQTSNYTYLQVEENDKKFWIAVVKRASKAGDLIYYSKDYEMKDFVSKELGRTFPSIFFVQDPSDKLTANDNPVQQEMAARKAEVARQTAISVKTPKGAITIADLYKNRDTYSGKTVTVRGVVVKYNHQIMNKNWVHIQDGTDFSGKFDLAITTLDSLFVGNTATFKGVIALNKDFGAGYLYDIIMEEAIPSDISR